MRNKTLGNWMKLILIGLGLTGVVFYFLALPLIGQSIADTNTEYQYAYFPWLLFLWLTGIPCFAVLPIGWKISAEISNGHAFTLKNAMRLRTIAVLTAGDAAFFLLGNVVFLFLGINLPGIVLASLFVTFLGVAITVAALALSSLTQNASDIREENELTI